MGVIWLRLKVEAIIAYRGSLVGLVKTSGQKQPQKTILQHS